MSRPGELLAWLEEAKVRGLIGPEPLESTLAHARALGEVAAEFAELDARLLDLGSGGGIPGLVLAIEWPESRWTLLDSNRRSAAFLEEAVAGLGLDSRVAVLVQRAEETGREATHRGAYGLVTARAVAPAAVVAEYVAPLLAPDGAAVIAEPPGAPERWDAGGLAELGLLLEAHRRKPIAVAVLRAGGELSDRYPRRTGIARKRPLW